jgi:hypothetical protein
MPFYGHLSMDLSILKHYIPYPIVAIVVNVNRIVSENGSLAILSSI